MARIIKKYPNRRLYDTETSAYITLAEVKQFVLDQQPFEVHDARTNEDLTRSILLQIILEEEGNGVPMFSAEMLANIIRYYGHTMQGLMGNYLERSIGAFHEAQNHFQAQSKSLYNIAPGAMPGIAAGATPGFNPDAWSKMLQGAPVQVPTLMNDYLEKSASSVMGMQEELRKKAMQMFSGFAGMAGANAPSEPSAAHDNDAPPPAASSAKRRAPAPAVAAKAKSAAKTTAAATTAATSKTTSTAALNKTRSKKTTK